MKHLSLMNEQKCLEYWCETNYSLTGKWICMWFAKQKSCSSVNYSTLKKGLNRRLFSFKPQAPHTCFGTIAFLSYCVLDKVHRMSTNRFSSIYFQSLKLPCFYRSDTGCHIHVRKENVLSAKMFPRPPYKKPNN